MRHHDPTPAPHLAHAAVQSALYTAAMQHSAGANPDLLARVRVLTSIHNVLLLLLILLTTYDAKIFTNGADVRDGQRVNYLYFCL